MTDTELPGMDEVERVPLPFAKQKPQYRMQLKVEVTGHATFTTWDNPEEWTEDDDNGMDLTQQVTDDWHADVDVRDWGVIEQLREDGTYGPVDWDAVNQRQEDREQAEAEADPADS